MQQGLTDWKGFRSFLYVCTAFAVAATHLPRRTIFAEDFLLVLSGGKNKHVSQGLPYGLAYSLCLIVLHKELEMGI